MRIFEFHFNPPERREISDHLFETFCYEPKNIYEKRLGSLYIVGEISNLLPQNVGLLEKISKIIKEKYYSSPLKSPEKSFQEALKSANDFLSQEVAKNNVSWLGNLNISILSLASKDLSSTFNLSLAKVGNIKIFSMRNGKLTNIGKALDLEGIDPYPLKVFTNIINGRIAEGDKIAILTSEIFEFFSRDNLLDELLKIEISEEKDLKKVLQNKEKEFSNIKGILFLIDSTKELSNSSTSESRLITFKKELEKFSLKDALSPLFKLPINFLVFFRNFLWSMIEKLESKIKYGLRKIFKLPDFKKGYEPKIKKELLTPFLGLKKKFGMMPEMKKNLISIMLLIAILIGGFLIFQKQEEKELKAMKDILTEGEQELKEAEKFIIIGEEKKAFSLLKENWDRISILSQKEWGEKEKAINLQLLIEEKLKFLSKLEVVEKPETIFEFDQKVLVPQKILYFKGSLYFFSPVAEKLFKLNLKNKELSNFNFGEGITPSFASVFGNSIIFFIKPEKIIPFKSTDGSASFGDNFLLQIPSPDADFIALASHQRNIYLLEEKSGEIIKYPFPFGKGENWLKSGTQKITEAKSMAIDGVIWVLRKNNTISRYSNGEYQEDFKLNFFPFPKKLQKIFTTLDLPYLYILEPFQNRIIVLDKNGGIIKQFQSNQFDNLKDFTVSPDGKTIYLLNGQKIHQLTIN